MRRHDLVEAFGSLITAAGVGLEFGVGWALIVGGALLVASAELRGAAAAMTAAETDGDS